MSNTVTVRKTGSTSADIILSAFRVGSFLTAGRTEKVTVKIEDSDELRSISANLNHMRNTKYQGLVTVNFGKGQRYEMDQSIWHEVANALLGFSLCMDCAKLGI